MELKEAVAALRIAAVDRRLLSRGWPLIALDFGDSATVSDVGIRVLNLFDDSKPIREKRSTL